MDDKTRPNLGAATQAPCDASRPLVSICIPVYNCEAYVGRAIESALAQTCSDFELIICDDCSTDGTLAVVDTYRDPRIRITRHPKNLGIAGNWNTALAQVRARYVKFLCADDYLYPDCLAVQTGILEDPRNRSVTMAFCRRDIVGAQSQRVFTWGYSGREGRYRGVEMLRKSVRRGTNIIGEPGSVLFRSELLPSVGEFAFGRPWVTDLDFWARIMVLGDVYATRKPLCAFRVFSGSMSVYRYSAQIKEFCEFISDLRADARFEITALDCLQGKLMAHVNSRLRSVFYRFILK
jgi:glycosyltransferase involved in cell wall biosynthesis